MKFFKKFHSRFVKIQKKLQKALHVLETFTRMHLEFSTDNYLMLLNEMSSNDSQVNNPDFVKISKRQFTFFKDFKFDTRNLEWEKYTENYFLGIKKFLLKEDMSKLDNYRAKYFRYYKKILFFTNVKIYFIFLRLKLMRNIIRSIFYLAMVAFFFSRFPAFKEYMKTFVRLGFSRLQKLFLLKCYFTTLN